MISSNIVTRYHGQRRSQRRGSSSVTRKAFAMYLIANTCTNENINCPIAANGFGFTSSVTNHHRLNSNVYNQHASNSMRYASHLSRSSRRGMGPSSDDGMNDSTKGDNDSTNENKDKRRRRFGRPQSKTRRNSLGTEKQKLRKWYKEHAPDNETSAEGGSQSSSSARNPRAKMKKPATSTYSSLLPPPMIGKESSRRRWENINNAQLSRGDRSSDGKPSEPIKGETAKQSRQLNTSQSGKETSASADGSTTEKKSESSPPPFSSTSRSGRSAYLPPPSSKIAGEQTTDLPEWGALFGSPSQYDASSNFPTAFPTAFPTPAIEGVLPVSELFYRSTQSLSASEEDDDDEKESESSNRAANKRRRAKSYKNAETDGALGDDEELPFSAEQSDRLSTPGNKIQIRRNKAADTSLLLDEIATGIGMGIDGNRIPSEAVRKELTSMARQEREEQRQLERRAQHQQNSVQVEETVSPQSNTELNDKLASDASSKSGKLNKKKLKVLKGDRVSGRKMVRRGMEMLVGGEPINADPPQRAIELNYYNKHPRLWNRAITLNSPDFGPLLHMHSAGKISKSEVGLYCENFVHNAQKWNICPDDLKNVVNKHELRIRNDNAAVEHASSVKSDEENEKDAKSLFQSMQTSIQSFASEEQGFEVNHDEGIIQFNSEDEARLFMQSMSAEEMGFQVEEGIIHDEAGRTIMFNPRELTAPKGFATSPRKRDKKKRDSRGGASGIASDKSLMGPVHQLDTGGAVAKDPTLQHIPENHKLMFTLGGELKFSLGITKAELESGHEQGKTFRRVLRKGIASSINAEEMGFDVQIAKLAVNDVEGGSTDVVVQFQLDPREAMDMGEAERVAKDVNGALATAMDDGKMAMALAHVAREEKGWPAKTRERIVEEFLFETEDDDEDKEFDAAGEDVEEDEPDNEDDEEYDGPFGMAGDPTYEKDDLWLGGGNGGVFFDYSESNYMNSPYKGALGPHLVDAAAQRAKQNQPRVIAIGDVHGCIDELQALLRKCDYHPGDAVVFLGDLVCKGPDSLSVVQMAREIGAIGVRGNHDFEVVRWHQAIKSGADPPVIGSEHYYVASALSTADLKWMYSLPWFISSSHLNALFVHAGFVSGIRLAKQNPRLMMNMRSILPDGTVTSKFFNNWPWARLWDGPQTVFFGHDADRGLQQYEHAIGLDTGCVYGGKLTACILPERKLVSVNAKREYFQYRRKHFD